MIGTISQTWFSVGLGPATALPPTLIDAIPSTAARLITVEKLVIVVRTNFGGAVPAANGISVLEYWVVIVSPLPTARVSSGYGVALSVNMLLAAALACVVELVWSSTFAADSAAASRAL